MLTTNRSKNMNLMLKDIYRLPITYMLTTNSVNAMISPLTPSMEKEILKLKDIARFYVIHPH